MAGQHILTLYTGCGCCCFITFFAERGYAGIRLLAAFGTIFSMGILLLIHSPIMVLLVLFRSSFGGPIGVLANQMGDIVPLLFVLLLGIIQTFGTVWAIPLLRAGKERRGLGKEYLTGRLCVQFELLKFIASTFHLGLIPFSDSVLYKDFIMKDSVIFYSYHGYMFRQ